MDGNNYRLIDIFISGPLQILVSTYIANTHVLRYFMLLTGIMNIIYNSHNYLLFGSTIQSPFPIIKRFVDLKNGKTQLHRLYNLFIMYPIFIIILLKYHMPFSIKFLFLINIFIGVSYNLFYYLTI